MNTNEHKTRLTACTHSYLLKHNEFKLECLGCGTIFTGKYDANQASYEKRAISLERSARCDHIVSPLGGIVSCERCNYQWQDMAQYEAEMLVKARYGFSSFANKMKANSHYSS